MAKKATKTAEYYPIVQDEKADKETYGKCMFDAETLELCEAHLQDAANVTFKITDTNTGEVFTIREPYYALTEDLQQRLQGLTD